MSQHQRATAFHTLQGTSCTVAGEEKFTRPTTSIDHHNKAQMDTNFDHQPSSTAPHGSAVIQLRGGSPLESSGSCTPTATGGQDRQFYEYASTTDLLLQNLTMVVGNPSARCYANAPWSLQNPLASRPYQGWTIYGSNTISMQKETLHTS